MHPLLQHPEISPVQMEEDDIATFWNEVCYVRGNGEHVLHALRLWKKVQCEHSYYRAILPHV